MGENWPEEIIIHPRKGKNELGLPENGLLLVNPTEAADCIKYLRRQGAARRNLFNSNLAVDIEGRFFAAGPAIGAPMAALTLEKLIALDAKRVILCGWCGAVAPELRIGDVLLPDRAEVGEGTSAYYGDFRPLHPHSGLRTELAKLLELRDISLHEGTVWSTDAVYREDRRQLAELRRSRGVVAVDMEFSALCAVAAFRRIAFAAVLVVSDELSGASWRPGFNSPLFQEKKSAVLAAMLAVIGTLKEG
jgi:uridine phosphorylase